MMELVVKIRSTIGSAINATATVPANVSCERPTYGTQMKSRYVNRARVRARVTKGIGRVDWALSILH
jgi:hypothetical protein